MTEATASIVTRELVSLLETPGCERPLRDFVAHFERLTRLGLRELPRRADLAIFLDDQRRPIDTISA